MAAGGETSPPEPPVGGTDGAREGCRDSFVADWAAKLCCCRCDSSTTPATDGCRGLGIEGALEGCKDSSVSVFAARFLCSRSVSSGASTTDGCLWRLDPPLSICTSGSLASSAGSCCSSSSTSGSGFGLDKFGSSPALMAFAIRRA